ncbi:hypothetical protein E4V01_20655 [Methylorubrum sp. Q1]|uniref:hypothetical protein n=1 Tax=Methylorubrum sp. Q1 TaxID=2562453 RepID=UPI00107634F6|nr:hypothetical protein [Methylorubrum sp. Q1]TFZ55928.1 hypothetical protein E4V01_20655 [Methylorubrum sp. Q1]
MSAATTLVKLPVARALQLKSIADARECTICEAVEHLLREEVRAGRLADVLPGFEVSTIGGSVRFGIGEVDLPPMHPAHARVVASLFQHAASGMPAGRGNALTLGDDAPYQLTVGRKGRGIVGRVSCEALKISHSFSMTTGMARDLSRQIGKAAARAQLA